MNEKPFIDQSDDSKLSKTQNFGLTCSQNILMTFNVYREICEKNNSWFPPPLYFPFVMQIYNIWYVFGKSLGSTLIMCQKTGKFAEIQICIAKSSYSQKNIHYWKALGPRKFKSAKTFSKFLKPKCAIFLYILLRKNRYNFFAKIFQSDCFCSRLSKEL